MSRSRTSSNRLSRLKATERVLSSRLEAMAKDRGSVVLPLWCYKGRRLESLPEGECMIALALDRVRKSQRNAKKEARKQYRRLYG